MSWNEHLSFGSTGAAPPTIPGRADGRFPAFFWWGPLVLVSIVYARVILAALALLAATLFVLRPQSETGTPPSAVPSTAPAAPAYAPEEAYPFEPPESDEVPTDEVPYEERECGDVEGAEAATGDDVGCGC